MEFGFHTLLYLEKNFCFANLIFLGSAMPPNTTKDRDWDLQDFLNLTPTEVSPRHNELLLGSPDPDLTNIGTEDEIESVTERPEGQRTTTASVGAEKEDQPFTRKRRMTATNGRNIGTEEEKENVSGRHQEDQGTTVEEDTQQPRTRKRRRTATDCRVEWRLGISSEKAAIIENENQITKEEMSIRERYGELKGVARVNEMDQDYKDRKNFKDIFKNVKKDLLDAKREITKVIVKEKQQQALKVRKNKKRKEDGTFDIAEITKQTLAEDIRVSLENCFCSKLYLNKLQAYKNSQVRYLTRLQTLISILADGISRTCRNKDYLYDILGSLRQVQGFIKINTSDEITFMDMNQKKVNYNLDLLDIV